MVPVIIVGLVSSIITGVNIVQTAYHADIEHGAREKVARVEINPDEVHREYFEDA